MKFEIILFSIISQFDIFLSKNCGTNPPSSKEECISPYLTYLNSTDSYCCFMTNEDQNYCKSIPKTEYYSELTTYSTENTTYYNVSCNFDYQEGLPGTPCKKLTNQTDNLNSKLNSSECHKISTADNKCCYYENTITNTTQCFWLGRFSNEVIKFENSSTLIIECSSSFLKQNTFLLFFIISFMLFNYFS